VVLAEGPESSLHLLWEKLDDARRADVGGSKFRHFEIRDHHDPNLPERYHRAERYNRMQTLRMVAPLLGYDSREGGWIYNPKGQPVTQGWANFQRRCLRGSASILFWTQVIKVEEPAR
jgi:hypothetical protein